MANNFDKLENGGPIICTPDTIYQNALGAGLDTPTGASQLAVMPENKGIVDAVVWQKIVEGTLDVEGATSANLGKLAVPPPIPV